MADTTTSALNWASVENGKVKTTKSKKSDESNNGTMGYDQFLTLLCAEMQYQDPLEPTSNTEYVAQLATFSQLEAMLGMQEKPSLRRFFLWQYDFGTRTREGANR